jgi:hypothetical protein
MGITISKPAINIREQLTELKAQQGYEERQFHFDNLVTNGTFDTDTDWTKGTNATISGGSLTYSGGSGNTDTYQYVSTTLGSVYAVQFTLSNVSAGEAYVRLFGTSSTNQTTSGTYTYYYVSQGAGNMWVDVSSSFVGSIDNISVYEVDPADNKVIHTMPKGWKPLHVFEDGALQREGSAYDYTVEYDGFNYIVKETVAPVAPYSTTVIGVRA